MANLNKVMLLGNLTRDPELRRTPSGTAVADLGIAVNRRTSDGNGGWKDETTFVDVTVWGTTAENASKYLTKGRGVFVEGRLQLDSWDDNDTGKKRTKLKVVGEILQFMPDGKGGAQSESSQRARETKDQRLEREGTYDSTPASRRAGEADLPDNHPSTPDEEDIPF